MNHLAHAVLAGREPPHLVGALLGDFVRGGLGDWPAPLAAGIRLHRRIDGWTDAHPRVAAARAWFEPPLRRYAGIVLDVWFDHLLAGDFEARAGEPLRAFCDRAYGAWVDADAAELPPAFRIAAQRYAQRDGLAAYRERDHVEAVYARIGERLARPNPVALALPAVLALERPLAATFDALWPEMVAYAAAQRHAAASHWPAGLATDR